VCNNLERKKKNDVLRLGVTMVIWTFIS